MARRSPLFSKKRSSRATISKKRKADSELQKPFGSKQSKKSGFQDDEEEIGDCIVVDTGTLDEAEQTKKGSTIDLDNDVVRTSRTSRSPDTALEDKKVVVHSRPHVAKIDSDSAQQARDALLVLDSASTGTAEGKRSRAQSLEISKHYPPSGSKDDSILVSPTPIGDEESPQSRASSPGPKSEELTSSVSIPLAPAVEQNTQPFLESEDMRTGSQPPYPSIVLPSTSPAHSPLDTAVTQLSQHGSNILPITQHVEPAPAQVLASGKMGNAPLGVLVTKGDQCPSKFVVSGIALNSEAIQEVPSETDPQARKGVSWIETVTETRSNAPLEVPESEVSGLRPCGSQGLGISKVLEEDPGSPRQVLPNSDDTTDPSTALLFCSDTLQPSLYPSENFQTPSSDTSQVSADIQHHPDQQRQIFKNFQDNEIIAPGDTESKRLPLPIQYPKISPETAAFPGPNLLRSAADKIVGAWWSTKLSCLDISPAANSKAIPPRVGSKLSTTCPSNSPPSLRFTFDNRAESTLTTVEVQRLVQTFVRDAVAIVPREQSTQPKSYPAGVIMWQSIQKFYKWYAKEEKKEKGESSETNVMKFELLDVHWQPENVFLLPKKGNLDDFRALKQCIWDLFWVASNLNGASATFRILVTRAPEMVNEADFGHLTASKSSSPFQLPSILSTPPSSHFVSENAADFRSFQRPEAGIGQHQHQPPAVRPPPLVTLDVEGANTPQILRDFLQKKRSSDTNGPPSLHSSPTRTENNETSTFPTDLSRPSLGRPEENVTAEAQPHNTIPPSPVVASNSLGTQYHISPPYHFGSNIPNNQINSSVQLPSLRPSLVITDTSKPETSHTNLTSSGSNYTANTARPLFAMPLQKDAHAFRTLLPASQSNRVPNTAKPIPDFQPAQNPPPTITDKDRDIQTEIAPPILQASRTPGEKMRLRDRAVQMVAGRQDVELEEDETTGGRKRTCPEISGVIVDKNSAMGIVVITERGYTVQQVDTGQDISVDQYTELTLRDGQTCVIHGSSTVLYYKPRIPSLKTHQSSPLRKPLPNEPQQTRKVPKARRTSPSQALEKPLDPALNPIQFTTEITIRLQIDPVGHFSAPYDLSIFRPKFSNLDFFKWFKFRTNHGSSDGPPMLRFTLKDAMPVATVIDVAKGDEEDYKRMREDILVQCEKARMFMPRLREFGVLIVDPQWRDERRE